MIVKYEKQAIHSAKWFAISTAILFVCITLSMATNNMPTGFGIFLALSAVGAGIAMLIFYFRGWHLLAKAKGYSPGFSLLGVFLFLLEDKSNPAKEAEEEKYQGPRCVCCSIRISPAIKICPKCGWTQPAADVPAVA